MAELATPLSRTGARYGFMRRRVESQRCGYGRAWVAVDDFFFRVVTKDESKVARLFVSAMKLRL